MEVNGEEALPEAPMSPLLEHFPSEQPKSPAFSFHVPEENGIENAHVEVDEIVQDHVPNGEVSAQNHGLKRAREEDGTDKNWPGWPGDNVFRLLVPVHKVGSIIGRKGEVVKKMCEDTRARIKILQGVPGALERVVMVTAKEDPELILPPAVDGLLRVHCRVIESVDADGNITKSGPVSSRLLVAATQAGSLIGRQGTTIKSIQETSGATVRVLSAEELPLCALPDDRVVELHGEPQAVHKAMKSVASHLRKFLVDHSVLQLFELNRVSNGAWLNSSAPLSSSIAHFPTVQHDSFYQATDQIDTKSHHALSLYGRDPNLTPSSAPPVPAPAPVPVHLPVITQVTQHMQIPLTYADAIIGSGGINISYMRRSSGATITIQETRGVLGEMTVEIHGSATEVQAAQQLLQNFMAVPPPMYDPLDPGFTQYGGNLSRWK